MKPLEQRLSDLEERVAALEQASPIQPKPLTSTEAEPKKSTGKGAVSLAGDVTLPTGTYSYQWSRTTSWITDHPWNEAMDRVAALAHPVRGAIMLHLLAAPASVSELVEADLVSSTGTAYHHLKELQAAGWVRKQGGVFDIPPARVIPLMAIVIAGEDH